MGVDQRVVAEHQAVRRQGRVVDTLGHGRVHAGERVLEVLPEGPLGVVHHGVMVEQPVVHGLVESRLIARFAHCSITVSRGHHMWGTSSGMS